MLPLLLLVAMAAIQLGIVGYTAQQAGHRRAGRGARWPRRTETRTSTRPSGRAAMSGWTATAHSFAPGAAAARRRSPRT